MDGHNAISKNEGRIEYFSNGRKHLKDRFRLAIRRAMGTANIFIVRIGI